ncbi:GNAT family N-acetyltransferase [Alteribacter aurantiacus]|uniref:GNAT family N-acetyltransferase n=1 Tax=Alteribacter aurantiacus TaxID=254410 RepID=UPI00040A6CC9|nr:GNAT family N-acetyltransferase [Alteribacter aurantiacus]
MNDQTELVHYSPDYLFQLMNFHLPREQAKYTSLPKDALQVSKGQHRIVILSNKDPAGFFILTRTEKVKRFTENPCAMLLTSLSINEPFQRKGIASAGMHQLKKFIKREFPACDEVVLSVNKKNQAAQQLYEKVGFKKTGKTITGPVGEQYILQQLL